MKRWFNTSTPLLLPTLTIWCHHCCPSPMVSAGKPSPAATTAAITGDSLLPSPPPSWILGPSPKHTAHCCWLHHCPHGDLLGVLGTPLMIYRSPCFLWALVLLIILQSFSWWFLPSSTSIKASDEWVVLFYFSGGMSLYDSIKWMLFFTVRRSFCIYLQGMTYSNPSPRSLAVTDSRMCTLTHSLATFLPTHTNLSFHPLQLSSLPPTKACIICKCRNVALRFKL